MNVLSIELMKLYKRKSTRVLLGVYAVMMLLVSVMYLLGETRFGLSIFNEGQFITASLGLMMAFILPFITLMVTSTSFALDFSTGTIKNMFLLPVEKKDVFIGKLLAIQSLIGALLAIQLVFTTLLGLVLDGGFALGVFGSGLVAYLGAFIVLGLVSLIAATLSLLVKSTGITVLISYIGYMAFGVITIYLPRLQSISLPKLIGSYEGLLTSNGVALLLPIASYYILFSIVGMLLFDKKEAVVCQYE
ncbi:MULTISPECIES: ABC transporter permease [unclassified Fusibacter]|uniref:ABC transporter permease n=1 Tax=unclassified Fusibacter TaxID=2624464 RepID=UPI001011F994|nr:MULTISPECIES: ABC transporter permease [unclassified Fusibacter]MCK8059125.1 ABC transporter permease [Fusibacter sp. A2]NPE22534.1 ABC transporter permease subunit [Fusibacter sp. A1]RXV60636.1 hypothetical protein DWB64_11850 [Fusibacter sp. A1]